VRLTYRTLRLDTNYAPAGFYPDPKVLQAIYFPGTHTGYWFGDDGQDPSDLSYSPYGMIIRVSERRGMSFSSAPLNEQGTVTSGAPTRERRYNYPKEMDPTLGDKAPMYSEMRESWWVGAEQRRATTRFEVQREPVNLRRPTTKTTVNVFHPASEAPDKTGAISV
jgi:hypothetical protein